MIIEQDLTFKSQPVQILEESERVLRNKTLKSAKVLWSHQSEREATWELESRMRDQYPDLFTAVTCIPLLFSVVVFLSHRSLRGFRVESYLRGVECNTPFNL